MNTRIPRPVVVASYLGVLALGVCSFCFICSSPDFLWGDITAVNLLSQAIQRREYLKQMRFASDRRRDALRRVVEELIAERCTLAEAMTRFRALDREWPDYSTAPPFDPAPEALEEKIYQKILSFVEFILKDRPEEAKAVADRLEREYQALGFSHGLPAHSPRLAGGYGPQSAHAPVD
jgi:hypothetical protein